MSVFAFIYRPDMAISSFKRNRWHITGNKKTGGSPMRLCTTFSTLAVVVTVFGLGGCSLFGSDDDSEVVAAEQAAAQTRYEPIEAILNIEIGRTRNGYVITAQGIAPGLGYGAPELRARREGNAGPDGIIDYDFVAQAPDPRLNLGAGSVTARAIRADLLVTAREIQGAAGIRVHGLKGGIQMTF
jgi:hypothetical protein